MESHNIVVCMKAEINKKVTSLAKINEISIFRAMESSINSKSKSIFVEETHSWAGFVEYNSPNCPVPVVKEIADLMIVSHNPRNKENRLCFLQAKYHQKRISPFLKFRGDFYQWELLNIRPIIKNAGKSNFPKDILSFTNFKSISSFGIFYHDSNSKIDMLYSIPDLLSPTSIKTHKKRPSTTLVFPGYKKCPISGGYTILNQNEIQTTCDLDMFEKLLLSGIVGAPINGVRNVEDYLYNAINKIQMTNDYDLLVDILNSFESKEKSDLNKFDVPNILFVKTNEEFKL